MKILINEGSVTLATIEEKLAAQFDYPISKRGKKMLVLKKSSSVGVQVVLRKKQLFVVGNFPTASAQVLFAVCIVLLGVIIPLLIYFFAYHKKMKAMENEVGDCLKSAFGT